MRRTTLASYADTIKADELGKQLLSTAVNSAQSSKSLNARVRVIGAKPRVSWLERTRLCAIGIENGRCGSPHRPNVEIAVILAK